jgi:hypothetical protein
MQRNKGAHAFATPDNICLWVLLSDESSEDP